MPVDSVHKQNSVASPAWTLVRDCVSGQRAIKAKGKTYLPMLVEQDTNDYEERYKFRARFFNVTGRTLEAFVGFIYNKDPQLHTPKVIDDFILDATLTGTSFYNYGKETVQEVLSVGRRGTLIDWDESEGRAYVTPYEAENIINRDTMRLNGHTVLSLLVLFEAAKTAGEIEDIFVHPTESHWRVYQLLTDDGVNYYVRCTILRKTAETPKGDSSRKAGAPTVSRRLAALIPGAEDFEVVEEYIPSRRLVPLSRIPFEFHNSTDDKPDVGKVPLEDLANTNISHYQTTADIERGRHICGNPTMFAAGFNTTGKDKLQVGSPVAWVTDNANAKAGFVEFNGQGLQPLEKALEEKKQDMAQQGARMLESQTSSKGIEAFETVQMRQSGEASVLLKVALACSESLSHVLQWVYWWHSSADKPEDLEKECNVRLNTEFLQLDIDPTMMTALTAAYQSNSLSYDEYFYKLQRGKVIRDDTTIDQETAALQRSPVLQLMQQPQQQQGGGGGSGGGGGN